MRNLLSHSLSLSLSLSLSHHRNVSLTLNPPTTTVPATALLGAFVGGCVGYLAGVFVGGMYQAARIVMTGYVALAWGMLTGLTYAFLAMGGASKVM